METQHLLEIAKPIYSTGGEETKSALEKIFGKAAFSMEWIEMFNLFCKEENLTITHDAATARTQPGYIYLPHNSPMDKEEERDNASRMIRAIIANNNKKLNFIADYTNKKQEKWFPIIKMTEAGFVFSFTYCEYWLSYTCAFVGSPFVSHASSEAERLCRKYLQIYIKLLQ